MRFFNELLQSPRALRALLAAGGVLGLLLLGLLAAPGIVRAKLVSSARERGFEAEVDDVRLRPSGAWLVGVRVWVPGEQLEARINAARLSLFSGEIRATGGVVRGRGDPERVLQKLRRGSGSSGSGGEGGRAIEVDGVDVRWERDDGLVEGFGARASRRGSEWTLGADLGRLRRGGIELEAHGLSLGLAVKDGVRRLVRLRAAGVELVDQARPAVPLEAEPAGGPRAPPAPATEPSSHFAESARALRAVLLPLVEKGLAERADIALDGASARVERGRETVSFGPSKLLVGRTGQLVRISLVPSESEQGVTPLALNVELPLTPGVVRVGAKGGPIRLSTLGIKAGQLGLRDVEQATLAVDGSADLSEDFETAQLDGRVVVSGLSIERPELSPERVGPINFEATLKARARTDATELDITQSDARLGEVRAELSGGVQLADGKRRVDGRLRVPLSGCQSLLDAMPNGLLPMARGMRLSGSFGIDLRVHYDASAPKDTQVALGVQNDCRVTAVAPELSPHRFERPFMREVKAPDGSPMSIEGGPGTSSWVSIDDISRHMETAILVCEDAGFYNHAGFDFRALENAIKDDLKQGRFARGASTVSMQLAKNLYLGKEKTLSRKLQEALLTMLLEQELDKRRILELYLNVVELGPGLYGVNDAARYYFATAPHALSLGQSLYLASLLPNPTYSRFGPDGKLNAGWSNYLRRLMHIARKIKRIDDSELQAGLEEEIAFRVPSDAAQRAPTSPEGGPSVPPATGPGEDAPPELDEP